MKGERLREYLTRNHINYQSIAHRPAYSSDRIAHTAHVPGKMLAKPVMVKVDDKLIMVVVPSNHKINFRNLKSTFLAHRVELAHEEEFAELFPDCETGGMPPFGNLYGVDVFISEDLREDEEIVFNAGNHTELIKLRYDDFERLVHPRVMKFV